jgi:Icc-related predicted phosphoesterase
MARSKIFFATDVHGSERTFLKFVGAAKFYDVKTLILAGDLTGKMIVPIVSQQDGTHRCTFLGSDVVVKNEKELTDLEKNIRHNGLYPFRTNEDGVKALSEDPRKVDQLFSQLMVESVRRWIKLAEERLKPLGVRCYISPGNDDRFDIDSALGSSDFVLNPEEKIIELDGYEMVTVGYSNITPFDSPRELNEDKLYDRIENLVSHVGNSQNSIFNFHCPPFNTKIDQAPQLDKDLRPIVSPVGGFEMVPVGSVAVRKIIEKHQPLLGLHGHVHESSGVERIGRTLCINPGSQYADGILRGALVTLKDGKVENYLLTRG